MMDPQIDPLADTQPPRYAIESDDEEDEVPTALKDDSSQPASSAAFDVKLQGPFAQLAGRPLLIATGAAGRAYARGASLGEQAGMVGVAGVQMGMLFAPPEVKDASGNGVLVLVSEALSTLPLAAMNPYAKEVLGALKPSRIALLDTYSLPTYASTDSTSTSSSSSSNSQPIRYLASAGAANPDDLKKSGMQPFSPPNLHLGTSAAVLALSAFSSGSSSSTTGSSSADSNRSNNSNGSNSAESLLVLLPSPHTPPAPPKSVPQADFSLLAHNGNGNSGDESSSNEQWSAETMNMAHEALLRALGVQGEVTRWEGKGGKGGKGDNSGKEGVGAAGQAGSARRRTGAGVGDGGMYI